MSRHIYPEAEYIGSPHRGGEIEPSVVVVHYSAGGSTEGCVNTFLANRELSAHFVLGRNGVLIQMVPCNLRAYHAGQSEWRGRKHVNGFSIGIELVNWGWLTRDEGGAYRSWAGTVVDGEPYNGFHKNGGKEEYWQSYTCAQYGRLRNLLGWLIGEYGIKVEDIVGHDDVSPGRKCDPGPAFHWDYVKGTL